MSQESTLSHGLNAEAPVSAQQGAKRWFYPLLLRLHFYIGLLAGPFIFIAALSGGLYAISPQIEKLMYADALTGVSTGTPASLAQQIAVAREVVGPDASLAAVRPAPATGDTTRVMFNDPTLAQYEHRSIFVDPITLEVKGNLAVYGTSGALPLRTWIDNLHRSLHMGDFGRHYSELAASWLWIVALGGLILWINRQRKRKQVAQAAAMNPARENTRRRHSTLGMVLLIGLLFLSVTGLTWSQWAGGNIGQMRAALGWGTPGVNTDITATAPEADGHAHHHGDHAPAETTPAAMSANDGLFDSVLATARQHDIKAGLLEIRPATSPDKAWVVREINRSWPTEVDSVAVNPHTMEVVSEARFADFPIAAKLTRWGIDIHMGSMWGLPNQLALLAFALGLCTLIVLGYRMWWTRRPTKQSSSGRLTTHLLRVPPAALVVLIAVAATLGWFLPVMGVSLAAFLIIDVVLMAAGRKQDAINGS
ncbi:PepSY-associated TM helix domain-containing protein [Marinobacter sp. BGYM27]|uniref:PepSY-associated TM helix domain-containing protein n=1 Tax=Marinobacter sp. BGYM27 TaxID=2975597 RepID=UPI0021A640A6|nr:PepSY-associated TM helix domain-containing protein [Marinobacter sp. BGYM27]MDG5501382.1 PepSY-associated TM helix domain-containing protein [Marinobacter sp. BGYM27]